MVFRPKYLFTITAGRTGTAWLADFLAANLKVPAIHEPLGIDDFGVEMPDIKIMRSFNERGNDAAVRAFWAGKLGRVATRDRYVETNHTLAKCGLVENLAESALADKSALIVLRRDRVRQCVSYVVRGDFLNITTGWQWYLLPTYRNNIVAFKPFAEMGPVGAALWFCYEMEARQAYYLRCFGDRLNFIEARLEELIAPHGATALLGKLGITQPPTMPPPANATKGEANAGLVDHVRGLVERFRFDPQALVDRYIANGRRL